MKASSNADTEILASEDQTLRRKEFITLKEPSLPLKSLKLDASDP
jgi:hypothetical protein